MSRMGRLGREDKDGWSRAFAPASVGNIGVGFDLLGYSIDGPRDVVAVRRCDGDGVRILRIDGDVPGVEQLPLAAAENTAGRALTELRRAVAPGFGFELVIEKGIALGSGLGGSAASSVAALVAANALLDHPLSRDELYPFAMDGESVSTGSRHGDNVAPMLLGGVVMALEHRMLPLQTPHWLWSAVVHPDQVLHTRRAREVLQSPYALADAITQSRHLALFLTGLQRADRELIRDGLHDVLVEPRRAPLIPGFDAVKAAALQGGALGASISGAGPSVFAWCDSRDCAEAVGAAMQLAFSGAGFASRLHVSPVAGPRSECLVDAEYAA